MNSSKLVNGQLDWHVLDWHIVTIVSDNMMARSHLHIHFQPRSPHFFDNGQHPERKVDVLTHTISHQLELFVRGHKADGAICIEFAQLDTLR